MQKQISLLFLSFSLILSACNNAQPGEGQQDQVPMTETTNFDWQGHRGARGLAPENSIPAFLKALEYPIQTLELDVSISKDFQVVVSHEPWMSPTICFTPNGEEIPEAEEEKYKIWEMDYAMIQQFNCGKKHSGFPEQKSEQVAKPLLTELVKSVEAYCESNSREKPFFNIEIKSREEWDGVFTPEPDTFAQLLIAVVQNTGIAERTCIQSFDPRALEAVHQQAPELTTAYLVYQPKPVSAYLKDLTYKPEILSPNYRLLSKNMVDTIHDLGLKVIPWTVNETALMTQLEEMGVDGIITDYPNRIPF